MKLNNDMRYHVGIGCSFGRPNHSAHKILADKLGAEFINLSESSKGNFRIYTELLQWASANRKILKDTTVSIGWSGIWRNDVITDANKFGDLKHDLAYKWTTWRADRHNETLKNMPSEMEIDLDQKVRFYTYVIGAQNFMQNLGIKYVMYNALDPSIDDDNLKNWKRVRLKTLESQIDQKHFFKFTTSHSAFVAENKYFLDPSPVGILKYIHNIKKNWHQTEMHMDGKVSDAHPSPEGNSKWAELVWRFSKDNQIL